MENFSNIIIINCIYQFDGKIKENYNWSGFAVVNFNQSLSENNNKVFNLEGLIIDKSVNPNSTEIKKRYLLGDVELNQKKMSFSLLPGNKAPFDYVVKYDNEDCYFYGAWYYVNENNYTITLGGYTKILIDILNEKTRDDLKIEINNWCMNIYYTQYIKTISYLIDVQKSNVKNNNEFYDSIFIEAKNYFTKIDKDKVLKLI